MDNIGDNIGYLVLKSDGAILQSGGDLKNDEHSATVIMGIINLAESVDENFIPNSGCERITIVYEDHMYNICMSNRHVYILKLKSKQIDTNGMEKKPGYSGTGMESGKTSSTTANVIT